MITTRWLPSTSSSSVKKRPRAGDTPNARSVLAVPRAAKLRVGSGSPARFTQLNRYTPISFSVRVCSRMSK